MPRTAVKETHLNNFIYRKDLVLLRQKGLTMSQIAKMTEVPVETIESYFRMQRRLKRLSGVF